MHPLNQSLQASSPARAALQWAYWTQLQRLVNRQVPLSEAFQILAELREAQRRVGADLGEREAWVVSLILAKSATTWDLLARPTLQFRLDHPEDHHLELG